MKRSLFKKLQFASFFAGLSLLIFLIHKTGWSTLVQHLRTVGWGFAIIVLLSGGRNYLRAGSWYYAIDPRYRHISLFSLTNIMLAGEAIKYLTATGPFVSEPIKASFVRRQVSLLQGSSSVVVENMIYYLSVFLLMLSALPLVSSLISLPQSVRLSSYTIFGGMILGIALTWFSVRRRWYVIALAAEWLISHTFLNRSERLTTSVPHIRALEDNIYAFYGQRQRAFFLILALNLSAHLINVIEVFVILTCMGLTASVTASYLIEVMTKLINLIFFFVPVRAGVYESGNALVLDALGMSAGAGVALAIIRKLRAFVWVGYGLAVLAMRALRPDEPAGIR